MSKLHILTMESTCCWRLLFLIFLSAYTDHVFCLVFCFLLYCFIIRQVMQLINLFSKKLDFRNMLMNVNITIFGVVLDCSHAPKHGYNCWPLLPMVCHLVANRGGRDPLHKWNLLLVEAANSEASTAFLEWSSIRRLKNPGPWEALKGKSVCFIRAGSRW